MGAISMGDFYGYPTRKLTSGKLQLECLTTAGPRVVRLTYGDSPNLLAEVPEIAISTPYGEYRYLGGHRLWHAPESMPGSYIPDGAGLEVSGLPTGLILRGQREEATGIRKSMEIRLQAGQESVHLVHTLTNEGAEDVELAPWAITMFRLGGTAILPVRAPDSTKEGLLPDRRFALWPYSRIDDPRLAWQDEYVLVSGKTGLPPLKIGTFNPAGWIAYWLDGVLFRKAFAVQPDGRHPDFGCNSEIYCDSGVLELEVLGPLCVIRPGESVSLGETWDLYDRLDVEFLPERLGAQLLDLRGRG
jgi:hypothetical protein